MVSACQCARVPHFELTSAAYHVHLVTSDYGLSRCQLPSSHCPGSDPVLTPSLDVASDLCLAPWGGSIS